MNVPVWLQVTVFAVLFVASLRCALRRWGHIEVDDPGAIQAPLWDDVQAALRRVHDTPGGERDGRR